MTFEASSLETEPIHIGDAARAYREIRMIENGPAVLQAIAGQRAVAAKLTDLRSEAAGIEAEREDAMAHNDGYPDPGQAEHIALLFDAHLDVSVDRLDLT